MRSKNTSISKKKCIFAADFRRTMRKLLFIVLLLHCIVARSQNYSVRFFDETDGLSHGHVSQILQDSTGMMWIATWNGLNRYDGTHFKAFKASNAGLDVPNDIIRRLYRRKDNNLLCRIEDRVLVFYTAECRFDTLSPAEEKQAYELLHPQQNKSQQLPAGSIKQHGNLTLSNILNNYTDRQGNIWSVAALSGFYLSTPLPAYGQYIGQKEVRSIGKMRSGEIVASVRDGQQLMVYDTTCALQGYIDANGALHKQPVSFGSLVYCIYETREGKLLLGRKPDGLVELSKGQRWEYTHIRSVYDIKEDNEGVIWVATFGYGLWRSRGLDDNGRYQWEQVDGTQELHIRRLLIHDGAILAATTGGLLVVDEAKSDSPRIKLHQRDAANSHSLSSNAVMCVYIKDGMLYVGTDGGGVNTLPLSDIYAEQPEFGHISTHDGLKSDVVYEIVSWSNHELVMQGNTALNIYNTQSEQITTYSKSYFGSAADSKWGEVAPVKMDCQHLLIAPSSGLLLLDKSAMQPIQEPVRIALSSIERNGKCEYGVDGLHAITLQPDERSIVLSFATLDYRNHGELLYSTRLYRKGEEKAWGPLSSVSDIFIQDIRPGDYIFEIRSTNAYGHLQDNTRRIDIHVSPMFIESTLGQCVIWLGALLTVILMTVITLQLRISRKRRAETLEAYLNLQERLAVFEQQHKENPQLPVPEILTTGYISENEQFVNALHQFLEKNLSNSELVMEDMAMFTNMSRASFNRKMKELFNLTPRDFVQAARIKHACSLLETTDMSAKEVAFECGFSDQRYFSKCFKSAMGQTPTEWRAGHA